METTDSRIAALARLDKTPEQVLAHRRAELQEQIRVLQQRTWFERYADWRYKHLKLDNIDLGSLILSFVFRTVELGLVLRALLASGWWIALYAFALIELCRIIVASSKEEEHTPWATYAHRIFLHLAYTPLLLIMPLVILVDIKVLRIGKQDRPRKIEFIQNRIERLTPHEVVPEFYAQGIEEARAELLGDSSELRKAERELRTHLEDIRTERETFRVRLEMAGDDAERVDPLNSELQELIGCEADLVERSTKHQQTIALTSAILEECERFIGRLPDKLMDHELILRAKSKVAGANHAIQKSEEAVARHIDLVRDRLMQLAAIVSAPQRELPSANPEGDMRTFFAHLDKVAEQVATLEAQKAF